MIKKTLLLLTLLVSVVTGIWADTATITFSSQTGGKSDSNDVYTSTIGDNTLVTKGISSSDAAFGTITCSTTNNCYSGKTGYGMKVGKGDAKGEFTILFTAISNVTKITLNCARYNNNKEIVITLSYGGTTIGAVSPTSTTFAEMTITPSSTISSLSTLTVSATKYCYIKSITITYGMQVIYSKESSTYPYRIPALAQNHDGKLIAIADNRPSGVDIGNGEVDLVARIDNDGTGTTWGTANIFADGSGGTASTAYGYGDAAVVADRESNNVLVMSCYATTGQTYYSGNIQTVRLLSTDGGTSFTNTKTWTASDKNTLLGTSNLGSFFTSGRILQSQYTKVGSYYRIYSALCVQDAASSYTSNTWVAYSDDFGTTWSILGGGIAITGGNEAKLEELPDGRIVVSSRKANGRCFNIFTYTNTANAVGSWGTQSTNSTIAASDGTGTNGEILIVPAKDASDNEVYIALQSVPAGGSVSGTATDRSHLSVYYKVLDAYANFNDPSTFATGWTLSKELSSTTSAYSTMILQQNGNIGILYEENSYNGGYDIVYNKFALSELASGYSLNTSIDRQAFLKTYFTAMKDAHTDWTDDVKTQFMTLVNAISATPTTAQMDAIYSFDPYDGKTVTLTAKGYTSTTTHSSSTLFTEYIYANTDNTSDIATATSSTDATDATIYQFVMTKGTNGGYTFKSVSNPTYYLGLSGKKMCISTTAQEFILTKMGYCKSSQSSTAETMTGYALGFSCASEASTTDDGSRFVAVSNTPAIDVLGYTAVDYGSSPYYTTDFTIEVVSSGFNVTCATATNGTISASPSTAAEGATVTLNATPATDYELGSYTVTKTDDVTTTVELNADGTSFTMPAYDVTISATFISLADKYDGYVVTLGCTGTSFTTPKYLYNNNGEVGVETLEDVPTDHKYQFIMKKSTNGYTLMSLSDPYYYVVLDASNNFSLANTGTAVEFTLTKNNKAANCGYTQETMKGYALQYTQVSATTGDDGVRFVAINADNNIDRGNYTTEYLKTTTDGETDTQTTYSTDFTLTADNTIGKNRYALTSDGKNVYVYHDGLDNAITNGGHAYLGDYSNYVDGATNGYTNSLAYVEDEHTYTTTSNNVVIKDADGNYTCANFVLTDLVDFYCPIDFTATKLTYDRPSFSAGYVSVCLPFAITSTDVNGSIFTFGKYDEATKCINMTSVESVDAGVPCIVKTAVTSWTMSKSTETTVTGTLSNSGSLKGSFTENTIGAGKYKLTTDGTKFGVTTTSAAKCYQFRSYVDLSGTSAKSLSVTWDDASTGISDINVGNSEDNDINAVYSLNGLKQKNMHNGINIVKMADGSYRKVMIK